MTCVKTLVLACGASVQLVAAMTVIPLLPPIAEQTCLDALVCLRPVSCDASASETEDDSLVE